MTFQQLHYILEVARTGSVSRAAENLFVTRPGVSFCIRTLEEELGYPIFLRTPNGLVPSPKGEKVLEYAWQICNTQQRLTDLGKESRPRIEIAITDYLPVENAVVRLLKGNRDRRDIAFTMRTNYSEPYRKLAAFELDLVVSCSYGKPTIKQDGLSAEELRRIPVVIVLGPGHRLYAKEKLTAADFENEVLLETPARSLSRVQSLRRSIPFDPDTALAVNINSTKNRLLSEGLVFAIRRMPDQAYIDRLGLRCLRLEGVYQNLCCIRSTKRPLPIEAERFLALLREELENYREPEITETITPLWMEAGNHAEC